MKKLVVILWMVLIGFAASAQSRKPDFKESYQEAQYEFYVQNSRMTSASGEFKKVETIMYIVVHNAGITIGGGSLPLPVSDGGKSEEVKSLRISNAGILTIKTRSGKQFEFIVEDHNLLPQF